MGRSDRGIAFKGNALPSQTSRRTGAGVGVAAGRSPDAGVDLDHGQSCVEPKHGKRLWPRSHRRRNRAAPEHRKLQTSGLRQHRVSSHPDVRFLRCNGLQSLLQSVYIQ